MQEELAETFPYYHLLTFSVIGEGICDDCGIVFVDDVVLRVAGGEDDGSTHGDSGAEEGGCGYVLVVNQGFVDSVKRGIGDGLMGTVASFGMDGGFGGVALEKWHVTSRSAWGYMVGMSLGGAGFFP